MFFDIRWKSTVALNTIKRKIRARFPRWKKAPRNSSNEVRSNVDKFRKILERGNFYLGQSCERNLRLKNSHVPGIPADQTYKEIEAQFPRNFAVTEKGSRGERLKVRKLEIYKNQKDKNFRLYRFLFSESRAFKAEKRSKISTRAHQKSLPKKKRKKEMKKKHQRREKSEGKNFSRSRDSLRTHDVYREREKERERVYEWKCRRRT